MQIKLTLLTLLLSQFGIFATISESTCYHFTTLSPYQLYPIKSYMSIVQRAMSTLPLLCFCGSYSMFYKCHSLNISGEHTSAPQQHHSYDEDEVFVTFNFVFPKSGGCLPHRKCPMRTCWIDLAETTESIQTSFLLNSEISSTSFTLHCLLVKSREISLLHDIMFSFIAKLKLLGNPFLFGAEIIFGFFLGLTFPLWNINIKILPSSPRQPFSVHAKLFSGWPGQSTMQGKHISQCGHHI